jgi:Spy/CpxP family protein refolding chaperone
MVNQGIFRSIAAALVILVSASLTWACGPGLARHMSLEDRVAELGLSEEVQAQVLQIFETHKQAVADLRSENQAAFESLREQLHAAKEAGDEETVAALHEQMKELMAGWRQLHEDLKASLSEVLTEEQMAQLRPRARHGRPGPRGQFSMFSDDLGLTEEQIKQAKAIFAEAREAAGEVETCEAKMELIKVAMQRVYDEVLTEEQQARADELKERMKSFGLPEELKMTEEQHAQAATICEEVKAAVEAAETREEKWEALRAGFQRFGDEVLTEEQRQWFEENMGRFHRRPGRFGRCGRCGPCGGRGGPCQPEEQDEGGPDEGSGDQPEQQHLD